MSDPRYKGGVLQGIKQSWTPGEWPDEVPGLGVRSGGQPVASCVLCPPEAGAVLRLTFVRYGGAPLCKPHAQAAQDWQVGPDGPVCQWPGPNTRTGT